MDEIDLSNLNRQFLFRTKDIGQSKAETAAKFVNERVPGVKVIPHFCRLEDYDDDFYRKFNIIIAGLDSQHARYWLNNKICQLVKFEDEEQTIIDKSSIIPLVDGGTEGFKGQVKVILPRITACLSCMKGLDTPQKVFPLCTIQGTPRIPEHCVEYAIVIEWYNNISSPGRKNNSTFKN